MNVECTLSRKSLGTQLREALNIAGRNWAVSVSAQNLLIYTVDGETMTPGQAAKKFLRS